MRSSAFLLVAVALIVLAGLAVYIPAFRVGFYFDDSRSIVDNQAITDLANLKEIWEFWPTRFLVYLSLAVNYRFSGLNPASYHAFNIAVHLAAGLMVFALLSGLFSLSRRAALAGALFFVLHPVQTQAVTYVIQRAASLGALFYLSAVLCYFKSFRPPRRPIYLLSLFFAVAAFFSKEYTFTLPFVLLLLHSFLLDAPGRRYRRSALIPFFILVLIIPAGTLSYSQNRPYNFSGQLQLARFGGLIDAASPSRPVPLWVYLQTQPRVMITYLRLLFYPVAQLLDYDYPFFSSFFRPEVISSLALVAALLIWAVKAGRKAPVFSAGILWFFITLLPESSVIPILDPIAEHRLYLPLFGAALLFGWFAQRFLFSRRWSLAAVAFSLVCLAALAFSRNREWLDPLSFWEANAARAPGKARPLGILGQLLYESRLNDTLPPGQREDYVRRAREIYERVVEIEPDSIGGYINLAGIHADYYRDYPRAKHYLQAAIDLDPAFWPAYLKLGTIRIITGELEPAIESLLKAVELNPADDMAYLNLSLCYLRLGRLDKVEEWLLRGIEIWPEDPVFHARMAILYRLRGEEELASRSEQRAAALRLRYSSK